MPFCARRRPPPASTVTRSGSVSMAENPGMEESTISAMVRIQMDALEEQLIAKITRMQQQGISQMWEQTFVHLTDIRQSHQNIVRSLQAHQNMIRSFYITSDDAHKKYNARLLYLEGLTAQQITQGDNTNQTLMNVNMWSQDVEGQHIRDTIPAKPEIHNTAAKAPVGTSEYVAMYEALQVQLESTLLKVDNLGQESQEAQMQMATLEEHCNSLRSMHEAKEELCRSLADRLEREDWDNRFKELHMRVNDIAEDKTNHAEHFNMYQQRLEDHEEVQEEFSKCLQKLQWHAMLENSEAPLPNDSVDFEITHDGGSAVDQPIGEQSVSMSTMDGINDRFISLDNHVQTVRSDMELRHHELALELREVVPRVKNVEAHIGDMQSKLSHMDAEVNADLGRIARMERTIHNVETQQGSILQKLEDLFRETQEVQVQMATLEERCNSLHTRHEAKEALCRSSVDSLEHENWDGHFKELHNRINDIDKNMISQAATLNVCDNRFKDLLQIHEELADRLECENGNFRELHSRVNDIDKARINHDETLNMYNKRFKDLLQVQEEFSIQIQRLMGGAQLGRVLSV